MVGASPLGDRGVWHHSVPPVSPEVSQSRDRRPLHIQNTNSELAEAVCYDVNWVIRMVLFLQTAIRSLFSIPFFPDCYLLGTAGRISNINVEKLFIVLLLSLLLQNRQGRWNMNMAGSVKALPWGSSVNVLVTFFSSLLLYILVFPYSSKWWPNLFFLSTSAISPRRSTFKSSSSTPTRASPLWMRWEWMRH